MGNEGHILLCSAGDVQAEEIGAFLSGISYDSRTNGAAFADVKTRKDLRGITRLITARRRS